MTASARRFRTCRSRPSPARPSRSSARTGSGKSTTLGLLHRAFDPQSGVHPHRRRRHPRPHACRRCGATSASCSRSRCCSRAPIRENLQVGRPDATEAEMIDALERAQAIEFITRQRGRPRHGDRRARPLAVGRRAPAPVDRPGAVEEPADPDPRRGDERARRRHRAQAATGARGGDEGPHHVRDRPSPRHHPQRRPHPRLRPRPHRRDRHVSTSSSPRAAASPTSRARSSWPANPSRRASRCGSRKW